MDSRQTRHGVSRTRLDLLDAKGLEAYKEGRISLWQVKRYGENQFFTVGVLCLQIACELVRYPVIYGPGDDEQWLGAFREHTRDALQAWHDSHGRDISVTTMSKDEQEQIHAGWRRVEARMKQGDAENQ